MANNLGWTEGSGKDIATDDVSDVHYQLMKLADGTEDATTRIAAGGGVQANALRVTIASDSTGVLSIDDNGSSITVDGTITANLSATDNAVLDAMVVDLAAIEVLLGTIDADTGAIKTAIEILDNAISGSEMQVDIVSGTVTANLGATDNAVLDAIQAAVEIIDNAISGSEMQVDIVSSAAVPVTDNAGSLTVDGTVTANLSATDNAVLDAIDAVLDTIKEDTEAIETAVEGTLVVDATGQGDVPVTLDGEEVTVNLGATDNAVLDDIYTRLAYLHNWNNVGDSACDVVLESALPAGTNAIGKLAANSGVDIGDVDVTSIAAGTNNIGKIDTPITTPTIYNVTLASADTEYSQALPNNTRAFEFQCLTSFDIRFAFETGKVATPTSPYITLKSGGYYFSPQIMQSGSPSTLYLASGEAGVVVQILAWT